MMVEKMVDFLIFFLKSFNSKVYRLLFGVPHLHHISYLQHPSKEPLIDYNPLIISIKGEH
jgi:hypothetical protein